MYTGYGSRKLGVLRPLPKKAHFLLKNGLKIPIWGKKTLFFGLRLSVQALHPHLCRLLTQKNMCCRVGEPENRFFRAVPT